MIPLDARAVRAFDRPMAPSRFLGPLALALALAPLVGLGCSSSSGAAVGDAGPDVTAPRDATHEGAAPPDAPSDVRFVGDVSADATRAPDGATESGAADAASDGGTPRLVYVTVGGDARRLISADGTTWTHDTYAAPTGLDNILNAVAVGAGVIVGVADSGIYTSLDGVSWKVSAPPTGESYHGAAIVYGGGRFVFVAGDLSYASPDGVTWQKNTKTSATAPHWQGIAYGVLPDGGHYMAIGDSCHKTSEDGLTWHDYVTGIESLASISFMNGQFVATGAHVVSATSTVARSVVSTDAKVFGADSLVTTTCYQTGFGGLVTDGTKLITTDGCNVWTSPDGSAWTKLAGNGVNRGNIVFAGGRCVGVDYYATLSESNDCTNFHTTSDLSKTPSVYVDGGVASYLVTVAAGELFQ